MLVCGSAAKKKHVMAQFVVTGGVSNQRVVRAFGIMQLSTTLSLKRIGCLKVLLFQHLQGAKENNRTSPGLRRENVVPIRPGGGYM